MDMEAPAPGKEGRKSDLVSQASNGSSLGTVWAQATDLCDNLKGMKILRGQGIAVFLSHLRRPNLLEDIWE